MKTISLSINGFTGNYDVPDQPTADDLHECFTELCRDYRIHTIGIAGRLEDVIEELEAVRLGKVDAGDVLAEQIATINAIKGQLVAGGWGIDGFEVNEEGTLPVDGGVPKFIIALYGKVPFKGV